MKNTTLGEEKFNRVCKLYRYDKFEHCEAKLVFYKLIIIIISMFISYNNKFKIHNLTTR